MQLNVPTTWDITQCHIIIMDACIDMMTVITQQRRSCVMYMQITARAYKPATNIVNGTGERLKLTVKTGFVGQQFADG